MTGLSRDTGAEPAAQFGARLARRRDSLVAAPPPAVEGKVVRMVGLTIEAVGCHAPVGGRCQIVTPEGRQIEAEVVGFGNNRLFLMPISPLTGLTPDALVVPMRGSHSVAAGEDLLGRVIDGSGQPLDRLGPMRTPERLPLQGRAINPLDRKPIREPLDIGVRAINSLLTIGRGQRIGLFAGSGVGKSTLLGMLARNTDADVIVVALIGERGREIQEFVTEILGPDGLKRAVVVAAPADDLPLMRLHGAWRATAIAEYFRDRGQHVLLVMDSLTRFAQAQREVALAIGEPPVSKGYPPSVFARLPQLVERSGNCERGSITGIYTVLVEGDDHNDPVVDAARAILDGHIVLSRAIAERGRFPAIDVDRSVSRLMGALVTPRQSQLAREVKALSAIYQQNLDLITVGAYRTGTDQRIDLAIASHSLLEKFISQETHEAVDRGHSEQALEQLVQTIQSTAV